MERVKAWDKFFVPNISSETIEKSVKECAKLINSRYDGATNESAPIFVSILNGAFMFTSDLLKEITFPCKLSFIKVSSYDGLQSEGKLKEIIGINSDDVEGRDVIIVDDIIDTGLTMLEIKRQIMALGAKSVAVTAFLYKSNAAASELVLDFPCIITDKNEFVIGYGLDYNEIGRNLKEIYILEE